MDPRKKIPGGRLVLGLLSAFRTLVTEFSKSSVLDQDEIPASVPGRIPTSIDRRSCFEGSPRPKPFALLGALSSGF
jgi:hypothetical protein